MLMWAAKPTTAPAAPTVDEGLVLSVYSDSYEDHYGFSAIEPWGQTTQFEELILGGNAVRYYTDFNYVGWHAQGGAISAVAMEKLHLDIWSDEAGEIGVCPIYGGVGLTTDDSHIKIVTITANQWNSIDLDLATDFAGLDRSSIWQFKFCDATITSFAIDNVYFYRKATSDKEAPVMVSATLSKANYVMAYIACKATDNSGLVSYDVFNSNEVRVASGGANSGVETSIIVTGLKPDTNYVYKVQAYDANNNRSSMSTVNISTPALPASAPRPADKDADVYSIYSDVYMPMGWFVVQTFGPKTVSNVVRFSDNSEAYFLTKTDYQVWECNDNEPEDLSMMKKLHVDIYAYEPDSLSITPISYDEEGNKEGVYTATLKANQWNSIDIPLSMYPDVDFSKYIQIKFFNGRGGDYLIDNVYFSKSGAEGIEEIFTPSVPSGLYQINGQVVIYYNQQVYDLMGNQLY